MNNNLTGYPHIDRPWRQYYDERSKQMVLPQGTMYDYFHIQNVNRKNDIAFTYFQNTISFEQLEKSIQRCAQALWQAGLREKDVISICMLTCPEAFILLYGANRIGILCNFIVVNANKEEMKKQIQETNSKMVFVSDMLFNNVIQAVGVDFPIINVPLSNSMPFMMSFLYNHKNKNTPAFRAISYQDFLEKGQDHYITTHNENLDAVIVYTSGTTGSSKGVVISNRAANASAFSYDASTPLWNFKEKERFLDILPPFYAYGVLFCVHTPLSLGMNVILSPDPMPNNFPKTVKKNKPHHFSVGPLHIEALANTKSIRLDYLETAAFGGDKVGDEWFEQMQAILKEKGAKHGIQTGYGMTEVAGAFATTTHNSELMLPLLHNNVRIVDLETKQDLQYNEPGEILVSTPTMMERYWNMEQETKEVIFEEDGIRWLHTGDLGYVREDGGLVISGRLKRIYWTLAQDGTIYRVYPMMIENVFADHPDVNKAAVLGIPDEKRGYRTIVYIESNAQNNILVPELMELAKKKLPASSLPDEIYILSHLPTTSAGKIDYKKLEENYGR